VCHTNIEILLISSDYLQLEAVRSCIDETLKFFENIRGPNPQPTTTTKSWASSSSSSDLIVYSSKVAMPLNYSKWDQLELSDDSDIEGHPNVDKRSLIRWKQRSIHEQRETRKLKISALQAELSCNAVLTPRLHDIRAKLGSADGGLRYFKQLVERLQTSPSPEAPPTNVKDQPTYDAMVLSLLLQVWDGAKSLPVDEQEAAVLSGLDRHIAQLAEHTKTLKKDLADEEKEQRKHITSEDIHEGFDSKVRAACHYPSPVIFTQLSIVHPP
jgi:cell division cycle protein 37